MYRSCFIFWKINGRAGGERVMPCAHSPSPKDRLPPPPPFLPWMGVPHCTLCKDRCQRTGGPNGQEKDMCQLESSGDWIGKSPWVLKATLFFKSFLLRGTPMAPCSCITHSLYTQSLVVRRNEKERKDRKWLYVISSKFSSWTHGYVYPMMFSRIGS